MRIFWLALGWLSIGLGILGIALPLLPTTPFLLLAAYAFSQGSERLHQWLLTHPTFGPPINDWNEYRAISRRVKVFATLSIGLIFSVTLIIGVPLWALAAQASVLTVVLFFLWTTRERPAPFNEQVSAVPSATGDTEPTAQRQKSTRN